MYKSYFHTDKDFDKSFEKLKNLERKLYQILINVLDYSYDNKKYQQLAKFLIRRFTIWKPTPSFPIYLCDIPIEIKKELMKLADPELDDIMNDVIDKIFQYSLQDEEIFNYNYFVKEVQEPGFLKWRLI